MTKRKDVKAEIEKALDLVGAYATELRDLHREHHTDLHRATGVYPEVASTQAAADPQYAARINRLVVASDNFVNALRGRY
jgi:hypothetical protein